MASSANSNDYVGCRVEGCRHKFTHTTFDHMCGRCGKTGHGVLECLNNRKKTNLNNFWHEIVPESHECTFPNCTRKHTHTIDAHHCEECGLRTSDHNHYNNCRVKQFDISDFVNKIDLNINMLISFINFNMFFASFHGYVFVRVPYKDNQTNKNLYVRKQGSIIKSLVVEFNNDWTFKYISDDKLLKKFVETSWDITNNFIDFNRPSLDAISATGYDELTDSDDEMPELMEFSDDEMPELINENNCKKCPVCRQINTKEQCMEIKGLSEECKVCMSNNVEILFSGCKHACVCKACFDRL